MDIQITSEHYIKEFGFHLDNLETEDEMAGMKDIDAHPKCAHCRTVITVVPLNAYEWCPFCGNRMQFDF